VRDLRELPKHEPKEFESDAAAGKVPYFEGCLPIEEMAARGEDALRYGPLKPVGLRDPRTGAAPYAVVQLRKENVAATAYNLGRISDALTWPAQKEAFGKLPGLANAEWVRLGVMHRNSFVDAPRCLLPDLRLRGSAQHVVRRADHGCRRATSKPRRAGLIAALSAARVLRGLAGRRSPAGHRARSGGRAFTEPARRGDFQPANVSWTFFSPLPGSPCATSASGAGSWPSVRSRRSRAWKAALERVLRRTGRLQERPPAR
jgi:methylenetetrahydrofolate--tRNA-(uracil-5-)-methyltransferase